SPKNGGFGLGGNAGANWSPDVSPVSLSKETTLDQAGPAAGFTIYRPDIALASDQSLSHVWLGNEPASEGMLPKGDQTSVGLSYRSGIVVRYVPWQHGTDAPPFSESQAEAHFKSAESDAPP